MSIVLRVMIRYCFSFLDPTQVIGLFPGLLPVDFQKQLEYPDSKPDLKPSEVEKGYVALIEYLTQVSSV